MLADAYHLCDGTRPEALPCRVDADRAFPDDLWECQQERGTRSVSYTPKRMSPNDRINIGPPTSPNIAIRRGTRPSGTSSNPRSTRYRNRPRARTEQERPVVGGCERIALDGERGGLGSCCSDHGIAYRHDRNDAHDADQNEGALHYPRGHVPQREALTLALNDRVDHHGGCLLYT